MDGETVVSRPRHRTVDRIAEILEAVASSTGGLTLTQLAVRLDAPVSSVQKLVNGLVAAGYLDERHRRFSLGPAPHVLSVRSGRIPMRRVAHADLVALSERTGTPVLQAVRVGGNVAYVDWAGADEPFDYLISANLRSPLHRTASGRVLLAQLPERERLALVRDLLGADQRAAVELLAEAERIRTRGWATLEAGHVVRSLAAVAVPVWEDGRTVGALAVTGPAETVAERRESYVDLLRSLAGAG